MIMNELKKRFNHNYRKAISLYMVNYIISLIYILCIYFNNITYGLITVSIHLLFIVWLEHKWKVNKKLKGTMYRKMIDYPFFFIYVIIFSYLTTK
ncbi:hypothetical protein SAMN05444955_114106 [Lihuaxuella thermophila]|uniref:Uncharacterized protein n=1 Tax=Lihuaxuella thermophila TaxID=1173111 RepID=A0A1H8HMG3_9BACL|nr:hypothetical protein SAMN05444955_114106 [Lihuaxuella thermophila]